MGKLKTDKMKLGRKAKPVVCITLIVALVLMEFSYSFMHPEYVKAASFEIQESEAAALETAEVPLYIGIPDTEVPGEYDISQFQESDDATETDETEKIDAPVWGMDESGIYHFRNGDLYAGEWFNDTIIDGKGIYTYNGIGVFTGYFIDNERWGQGTFSWFDGSEYVGEWDCDKAEGDGKFTSSKGWVLKGSFTENKLYSGTVSFKKSGVGYKYTIKDGKYSGKVTITYKNGSVYSGKYKNQKLNGKGTMKYKNGDSYTGNFKDGVRSGTGTYKWENGAYYKGKWSSDKMNGTGTYYYEKDSKGKSLTGKFKDNKPNGKLVYKSRKSKEYYTTWTDGKCRKVQRKL